MRQAGPALACLTVPDEKAAERIARLLVERRLAAAVNLVPRLSSFYRWQGEVHQAEEVLLLIKTRFELAEALGALVEVEHPYTVPSLILLPVSEGLPATLAWIAEATSPESDSA